MRDKTAASLREEYGTKRSRLDERLRRAQQAEAREDAQASQQTWQTAIAVGATVLNAFIGRKTLRVGTVGRATTAARSASRVLKERDDVTRARENVAAVQQEIERLEAEFEAAVAAKLLAEAAEPITVTIDRRNSYDADDMKVCLDGERLSAIGKWLAPAQASGESIGMMLFRGRGPELFTTELEQIMRSPEGLDYWYTSAIDALAKAGVVGSVSVEGLDWSEIDFPVDLQKARTMVARWSGAATESHAAVR